jgi:hypothetical protein
MFQKRVWHGISVAVTASLVLSSCGSLAQDSTGWGTETATSALEACQIEFSSSGAASGPVSAVQSLEANALVTANGWLVADLATSWDKSGLSPIELNCMFSELGLSPGLISVITDDAKQQKANYRLSGKSSSEYRKALDSLEKRLADAKAAPEWNERLAAYSAELKAWACSVDDDCQQYWIYTVAGDLRCKVAEFCTEDFFPKSPRPAGPKVEKKLEQKIEATTQALELSAKFEEDSPELFKAVGELDLEMAFVFDGARKLTLVMRQS